MDGKLELVDQATVTNLLGDFLLQLVHVDAVPSSLQGNWRGKEVIMVIRL